MRNVNNDVEKIQQEEKLYTMLFLTHAFVSMANAGRVVIQGMATQNHFEALRNVNIAQWQMFAVRAIQYAGLRLRERTVEEVVAVRKAIEENWKILDDIYGIKQSENETGIVIL